MSELPAPHTWKAPAHDPFCPVTTQGKKAKYCACPLIAKIRADERAKVRALVAAEPSWIADNDMVSVFIKATVLALLDGVGDE